ncbi:MAG: vanadium-dependent haloperoxidase [Acidimicrobiales bacterium]
MRCRAVTVTVVAALAVSLAACSDDGGGSGSAFTGAGAEPDAGKWKTYILSSPSEVRVPAPPTGSKAEDELEEVARLAGQRTQAVQDAVKQWSPEVAIKPWIDVNIELVSHGGVKDPPTASRSYAATSVAMYDAVVAAWHWKYEYNRKPPAGVQTVVAASPSPSYPDEYSALAGAASTVLSYLFPAEAIGTFDDLAKEAAESRVQAGVNFRSDVEAGLALGWAVGEKVIARLKADGFDKKWDGTRPAGIADSAEFWHPPPGIITPPVQPVAGTWKPWVLTAGNQFRAPAPAAYGSPQFMAELQEVQSVKAGLTDSQKSIAQFWAGGAGTALPPGLWNQIAFVYIGAAKMDTPRAARAIAALNVAEADAAIAVWDTKFAYWTARPLNAVRSLGLDPTWTSFLGTPIFPSYVSGHAGFSGAAATVLSYFFPNEAKTFSDKAQEAAMSRLYGGIHYRSDNDNGLVLGNSVGQAVVDRLKQDGAGV